MVGLDTGCMTSESGPFGGVKQSGIRRESSRYGLGAYLEMKNLCMGGVQLTNQMRRLRGMASSLNAYEVVRP